MNYKEKLAALRKNFDKQGVSGFLVPHADEFQNEFMPACAEALAWLTGFTGSAGHAIVFADKAAVFSDGRYTIQLAQQVDKNLYQVGDSTKITIGDWLAENAGAGAVIGYDAKLHTAKQIDAIESKLAGKDIRLAALAKNPLDDIWTDRPAPPQAKVEIFPEEIAGRSSADKRMAIAEQISKSGSSAAVITLPDSIAWLLNIRGMDVAHNPVALSYAVLHADGSLDWYINATKLSPDVLRHIGNGVRTFEMSEMERNLAELKGSVLIDTQRSSKYFLDVLQKNGIEILAGKDPCIAPKAVKTPQEQKAMRDCHIRDGVAVSKFLYWLSEQAQGQSEVTIAERFEEFRREDKFYRDSSFETICGWAANGAIVHYRAEHKTAATISGNGLLLVDSGAQYRDGTTDVTRTLAIGQPTAEMKDRFTRVLKGHIVLAMARFPKGTNGAQLDTLARKSLWEAGLDYAHGTGHGVGCYLSVHEEAASISPRGVDPVLPGMIVSNEPGYYKQCEYGIRIENLILCHDTGTKTEDGREMLEFETLTLAPIDTKLIDTVLLSDSERNWLNAYHARVYETLTPFLMDGEKSWLKIATSKL